MLKDLRDQATRTHKDDTCYIRWEFREIPDSAYSFEYNPITRNLKENGGLPSRWDESDLENLYRGLTDGRVQAFALDEQKQILGESNAREAGARSSSKRTRLPHKLRDRLIETIELAIGRPLDPRSAKTIDPRKSDPQPPNLYKWQFSEKYPSFPDKKGGISRWHADQIHACYEALDQNYLSVVNVELGSSEAIKSLDLVVDSAGASQYDRSSVTRVAETPLNIGPPSSNCATVDRNSVRSMTRETQSGSDKIPAFANTMSGPDQASTSKGPLKGLEFLQTQMFGMLSTALQSQADELEDTWRARQVSKQNELQAALEDKENKLQVECATHRKTLTSLLALQRDAAKVRTKVAQLEQDLEDKVANAKAEDERVRVKIIQLERDLEEKVLLARNEGRQSMSDEILKDLDHTMEGERLALRRNHVEQLVKVRADSYELGVQAERKAAASEIVRPGLRHVTAEFENLKQQHKEELQLARKTGRESAYTELSLGPDERVNFMLQNHADLNSNRKIRELKTIYQNWDDIPQRVLPSFMLPEGHTPGDKTLYLLAKLSKEVDGAAACRLLQGEIDRRCKHSSNQSKCRIVTNSDVRNVLDRINPGSLDWPTSQGSMDQSQTPVLTPQDQGSSVPRTRDRSRERSKPQSKDLPKDSASEHPIQLTYEEMTDMFQVWQRNAFDLAVEQWVHVDRSSSPMAEECRSLNSNDSLLGKRFEVQSAAKLAGMTGKPYSTATELKILKQYLVDLTRELVGDDLYEAAEIVQTFKIIHSMFNHYNDLDLASKTKDTASAITLSANTPSRNLVMTSNRPVLGEAYNAPKRPTTDLSTPLFRDSKRCKTKITSSVSSLVQERQPSTRNSGPSLEISGSTIIVDSNARLGASAAVKKDEESEEDDLYSASPPPRVKKRGASKKGSGG